MTLDPTATTETTPVSGGETPEPTTGTQSSDPYKAFSTQAEYEAQFGPIRTEGRLSVAKKYGFDTLEAFDAEMTAWREHRDSQRTKEEQLAEQNTTLQTTAETATQEAQRVKLEAATQRAAIAAGVDMTDPTILDDVMALRQNAPGEVDADGNPNLATLQTTIEAVLARHPYMKAGAKRISGGNPPRDGEKPLHQQIQEAREAGNIGLAVSLEMSKLNTAQ